MPLFPTLSYMLFGQTELSSAAKDMIAKYKVPDLIDYHVHVLGLGNGSDCTVHPKTWTWNYLKTWSLMRASGISKGDPDVKYLENLSKIIPGKAVLLAFDKWYNKNGTVNVDKTTFCVTNDYVINHLKINTNFLFGCSVNPYRPDALEELQKCKRNGAVLCKWLPNAMGIDPSDPQCIPFYLKLVELGMPLLSHTGHEHSVNVGYTLDSLGRASKLQLALDNEVTVIAAHASSCSSEEEFTEFCDLYKKYKNLYADISAVTFLTRVKRLRRILELNPDKLVYGSDYPLPSVFQLTSLYQLCWNGFIKWKDIGTLREIWYHNALVFDYILKRCIGFDKAIFSRSIFQQEGQ